MDCMAPRIRILSRELKIVNLSLSASIRRPHPFMMFLIVEALTVILGLAV